MASVGPAASVVWYQPQLVPVQVDGRRTPLRRTLRALVLFQPGSVTRRVADSRRALGRASVVKPDASVVKSAASVGKCPPLLHCEGPSRALTQTGPAICAVKLQHGFVHPYRRWPSTRTLEKALVGSAVAMERPLLIVLLSTKGYNEMHKNTLWGLVLLSLSVLFN